MSAPRSIAVALAVLLAAATVWLVTTGSASASTPTVVLTVTPNPVAAAGALTMTADVTDPNTSPQGAKVVFCFTDPSFQTCDVEQSNEFGEAFVDDAGTAQVQALAPSAAGNYDVFATYYGIDPGTGVITGHDSNHVSLAVGSSPPPGPTLNIADTSVPEGNRIIGNVALFPLNLSAAATSAVTATAVTADGTATRNSDYVSIPFPVHLAAGQTRTYVPVLIIGDRVKEPDETFTVILTKINGAAPGRVTAVGTIINDD